MELFPLIMLVLLAVLLFVLPARQRKAMQARAQALQESLTIGSPVMTTSGMHATVVGLGETTVDLELAPGVVVTFARQAVLEIREPVTGTPGDDAPGTAGGRPADDSF
ncbi:preprotein translocase subunit YajC [Blastococcus sp. TML/M2B]|uniref:preprotein translocase subunit YajC n=1 Tax=unclassified Blastococcus TaxID=2619396 RepID=UPI00190CA34C|nr:MULTISPECIES: preprotein translocase subunit YajC [unclassified Blastococcus]MBN1092504.1 preprotein translocase subunit YajC [Blastococcus sp. TML/M2B]MBN1097402.1 preprotein translocase subunit YajC [Blastococcus sp. TML/C7B]